MQTQTANTIDQEAVARKAYELWVAGGRKEGVAEQNWAEAERIVRESATMKVASVAHAAPKSDPPSAPRASSSPPIANYSSMTNGKKPNKRH